MQGSYLIMAAPKDNPRDVRRVGRESSEAAALAVLSQRQRDDVHKEWVLWVEVPLDGDEDTE